MNSELSANLPGVVVEVARGADLISALLRIRFLGGTTAALLEATELAFESARLRLPTVFFGACAGGAVSTVTSMSEDITGAVTD